MEVPVIYVCGLVAYDGADFNGFQYQVDVPTIQGTLEESLSSFAQREGRVAGAGRTDSGVHANGQVIAVRVRWRHRVESLQEAWNARLPRTISLRRLRVAPEGFHPRFSALSRTYRYTVVHGGAEAGEVAPRRSPLSDRYALFEAKMLDVAAMQQAAGLLVGEHDFATFGQPTQGESTVRRVEEASWQEVRCDLPSLDRYPGQRLVFTVTANGFLRQMVRSMVGTLLAVGLGQWSPEDVATALAACDRSRSAPPAPPHALVLEKVRYPEELEQYFRFHG